MAAWARGCMTHFIPYICMHVEGTAEKQYILHWSSLSLKQRIKRKQKWANWHNCNIMQKSFSYTIYGINKQYKNTGLQTVSQCCFSPKMYLLPTAVCTIHGKWTCLLYVDSTRYQFEIPQYGSPLDVSFFLPLFSIAVEFNAEKFLSCTLCATGCEPQTKTQFSV